VDGFASDAEVSALRAIADRGMALGGGSGGPTILDLQSGALSFEDKFIDVWYALNVTGQQPFTRSELRPYAAVVERAAALHRKANVPAVREHLPLIKRIQEDSFWDQAGILDLEKVRRDLRSLMRLLDRGKLDPVYLDIEDEITIGEFARPVLPTAPENYLERVAAFVREHQDYMVIRKLRGNEAITPAELQQLEDLLFDGDERGTKADLQAALGTEQPLGLFIRSILGLERRAALDAFADFLQKSLIFWDRLRRRR
jgi:type I restriction enzyme R subunit